MNGIGWWHQLARQMLPELMPSGTRSCDREEAEWRKRVRYGSPVPLLTLGSICGLHSPECHTWSNWLALLTDGLRTTEWWLRYSSASVPPRRAFMEAIAFLQVIVVLERIVVHASAGAYPGRARAKGLFSWKASRFSFRENFPSFWVLRRFLLNNWSPYSLGKF